MILLIDVFPVYFKLKAFLQSNEIQSLSHCCVVGFQNYPNSLLVVQSSNPAFLYVTGAGIGLQYTDSCIVSNFKMWVIYLCKVSWEVNSPKRCLSYSTSDYVIFFFYYFFKILFLEVPFLFFYLFILKFNFRR